MSRQYLQRGSERETDGEKSLECGYHDTCDTCHRGLNGFIVIYNIVLLQVFLNAFSENSKYLEILLLNTVIIFLSCPLDIRFC